MDVATLDAPAGPYIVECAAQGVEWRDLDDKGLDAWVEHELEFWKSLPSLSGTLVIGQRQYGSMNFYGSYSALLQAVQKVPKGKPKQIALAEYLDQASQLRLILRDGVYGLGLQAFLKEGGSVDVARTYAAALSYGALKLGEQATAELDRFRFPIVFSPWASVNASSATAEGALKRANSVAEKMREVREDFDAFVSAKRESLGQLEELYAAKLLLEGPSRHWRTLAQEATTAAWASFATFAALLIAPAAVMVLNWTSIAGFLFDLVAAAGEGLSLTGLAVVTIPALAYGWLLRHVSRVFVRASC